MFAILAGFTQISAVLIDNLYNTPPFELGKKNEILYHSKKRMQRLVELRHMVAKYCKIRKI